MGMLHSVTDPRGPQGILGGALAVHVHSLRSLAGLRQSVRSQFARAILQPMLWDDLRVFLAVARRGSHKAAARQLGVDPTTVGRRLAALDAALGVKLFER